jgi:hypothetical protein
MSTLELNPNGIESVKVIPEQGQLRVQIQYRALGEGAVESIALDVVLPPGDRTVSDLEFESMTRAMWLLDQFLGWANKKTEKAREAENSMETTASLEHTRDLPRKSQQ